MWIVWCPCQLQRICSAFNEIWFFFLTWERHLNSIYKGDMFFLLYKHVFFGGDWLEIEMISNADKKCCFFDRGKAEDASRLLPLNTLTASPQSAQQIQMQMVWKSGEYGIHTDGCYKLAPAEGHGTWSPWHPSRSLHKRGRGEREWGIERNEEWGIEGEREWGIERKRESERKKKHSRHSNEFILPPSSQGNNWVREEMLVFPTDGIYVYCSQKGHGHNQH